MSPGDVRLLANAVQVVVHQRGSDTTASDKRVYVTVERDGHIGLNVPRRRVQGPGRIERLPSGDRERVTWEPEDDVAYGKRLAEIFEWLVEVEFARLRPIGPEDSEYFLTEEAEAQLRPVLSGLDDDWVGFQP